MATFRGRGLFSRSKEKQAPLDGTVPPYHNTMRSLSSLALQSLLLPLSTSWAFVVPQGHRPDVAQTLAIGHQPPPPPPTALGSSVATDDKAVETQSEPPPTKGGLSMTVDELALQLGGRGRARLAWDCYSIGVDPALFYGSTIQLGHDDFESILELLPSGRRSQRIGADALAKLAATYPEAKKVEGGVACLSYVSQSSDQTTKLLLRLADGLEVETVIIPWKGSRSTLCISSQVGCRQVRLLIVMRCRCVVL